MSKHHSKSVASSSVDSGSDPTEQPLKDLLSSLSASLNLHIAPLVSQMASLQEDFRSFKTDTRSSIDAIHSKIDANYEESTNTVRTLTDSLATLRDSTALADSTAEMKLASDVVKEEHRQDTKPFPLSLPLPETVAQTITNCTYPNAPLLSHHPTHVVSWFRQSILRKTKLTTTSKTFHYDAMRKFSPEVFLTLRDMARMNFNSIDFRFPADDDAFYAAILTTIFWDKNYDNLLSLFQSAVSPTSDQFSNHVYVCGVRSIITILPEHLNQYDIKHIISAVRKFLTPPLQLLFDGYCTTITSLDHIVPALLRSLAASHANHARSSNSFPQPYPSIPQDRLDRPHASGFRDSRSSPSAYRDSSQPDPPPPNPQKNQHRINNVALTPNPKPIILDPSEFVLVCEHCGIKNDHYTYECPHPCQSPECSSKFVLPHAHKDCPWYFADD